MLRQFAPKRSLIIFYNLQLDYLLSWTSNRASQCDHHACITRPFHHVSFSSYHVKSNIHIDIIIHQHCQCDNEAIGHRIVMVKLCAFSTGLSVQKGIQNENYKWINIDYTVQLRCSYRFVWRYCQMIMQADIVDDGFKIKFGCKLISSMIHGMLSHKDLT